MPTLTQPVLTNPFVLYQSTRLSAYTERVIHGFTGKPLTLGGPGYLPETIATNRLALCQQSGLNHERLVVPRQTHTRHALLNQAADCHITEADAVILTEPGIPALVQAADCVPIILYDPAQHVGAVVHAGWRGTAQSITASVTKTLINQHGASPETLIAAIGPAIGGCCYEVSQEVATAVLNTLSPTQQADWAAHSSTPQTPNGKPHLDLKRINQYQLEALGVFLVEQIQACTRCQPNELWSYRRGENGRQVAFLQLQ